MRARGVLVPLTVLALLGLTACSDDEDAIPRITQPTATVPQPSSTPEDSESPSPGRSGPPEVTATIASGLSVPWGLDFLPDGHAVVTERDSRRVLRVSPEGEVIELGTIDEAVPDGEAGLLGVAVPPDFDNDDPRLLVYATTADDNRVLSVPLDGDQLGDPDVVLSGIPDALNHDGGRIEIGPDGHLYIATGDVREEALAQDPDSLAGKILRVTTDGEPAPGNPTSGSPVWSLGHRNVQGLTWDDQDRMWASEFGSSVWDEVNLIEPGSNYGWPHVEGAGGDSDYVDPLRVWPTDDASPSGIAYLDGSLWMAGLRGERLWEIPVLKNGSLGNPIAHFEGEYGRLRSVAAAPDGTLWVTTSNHDGRGNPADEDDRILQVTP